MEYRWLIDLLLLVIGTVLLKVQAQVSITARQPNAKVKEGSNFTLTWDFYLPSGESFREIVFGLWEKGYTGSYFITVTQSRGAVQNPDMSKKHPSYVGRVQWVGDISKSYAAFRLSNIKLSDNKTYGCQLGIGGFGQTKDSKMTLTVEKSSLVQKKSTIVSVPSARIGIVGEATEFKWVYRYPISDADFKAVQLTRRTNPQTKSRLLWKVHNSIHTTLPKYANRLFVSVISKKEQDYNAKSYTFKIVNLTRDDEGDYEFKVGFTKGQQDLRSGVFLDVLARPRIIDSQQVKGIYKEGQTLLLACESNETSTPKVRWIKNGRVMPHHAKSFYLVSKLSKSDAGVYSCCAYYPFGNVSSLGVRVRVQYAPRIISPSKTKTVLSWKGNPTRLQCSAVGDPAARFFWTRADKRLLDGEFETSGNTSVLTIIPSADSDFSNYTCTSRNVIGEDSKEFILKPIRPPSPPTITNIVVNYNAIKVSWKTPSTKQDTPITGHVLRIKKQGEFNQWIEVSFKAKTNYYILGNLTRGTNYIVCLYATNVAGISNASEEKQVKTPINGRPSLPRLHFTDVKINHTNFLVTWDFPGDDGGAEVNSFTVWYRAVQGTNYTQDKWLTVNTTKNSCYLKLNCCTTYEIMVTAWNKNGPSIADPDNAARITVLRDLPDNSTLSISDPQEIERSYQEDTKMTVVLNYLPIAAVLIIPVLVCCLVKSRICKKSPLEVVKINDVEEPEDEMEVLAVSSDPVPHVPLWEFPRSNLAIERVIGNGAFGVVSKAYARDLPDKPEWTIVAVKSVQDDATESERRDLFSELNLLKKLKPHPHIIRLLGCITTEPDGPFVIIEYVPYGDLLGYLRRSRGVTDCYYDDPEIKPSTNLTSDQMLKFAWQISDGMRYIASKKILHRDLAARNVLVGENHRCKITDFGMARDVNLEEIYVPRTEGRIPVKWTAIEAMTGAMKYSTQSDVWSFGVVLFEICTIGAEPYPGISPFKLPNVLLKGYRLPKPEYVKEELYAIMMECWETEPKNRPSFNSLCNKIKRLEVQTNQNYVNIKDCLEAHENEATETSCLNR